MTSDLTRRFDTIAIEDLNVLGMMSNRHLARSIADMSLDVNWSIKHLCEVALLSLQIDGLLVASYVLFVLKKYVIAIIDAPMDVLPMRNHT